MYARHSAVLQFIITNVRAFNRTGIRYAFRQWMPNPFSASTRLNEWLTLFFYIIEKNEKQIEQYFSSYSPVIVWQLFLLLFICLWFICGWVTENAFFQKYFAAAKAERNCGIFLLTPQLIWIVFWKWFVMNLSAFCVVCQINWFSIGILSKIVFTDWIEQNWLNENKNCPLIFE